MPLGRKSSKRVKKYRRTKKQGALVSVRNLRAFAAPGRSLGFPKNQTVQIRYCTSINLADTVGGIMQTHYFRANGINDPDASGVGHQPLGHDQWVQFYNHYYVKKATISVKLITQNQVANQCGAVHGIYVSDDQVIPPSWTTLAESGRAKYLLETNLNTETKTLTASYSPKTFMKQGRNQSQLGALVGTLPPEQIFFGIYAQSADEISLMTIKNYVVQIDYLVQFTEPKDLAQS